MKRLRIFVCLLAALFVAITAHSTAISAQEHGKKHKSPALEKEVKAALDELAKDATKRNSMRKLEKKMATPAKGVEGKISGLQPCRVCTLENPVNIEVIGEAFVSAQEPRPRLFVLYILLRSVKSGEWFLRNADSMLISPGSGVCFIPNEKVYNLPPDDYQLVAQLRSANADGSETIHDTKVCRFIRTSDLKSAAKTKDSRSEKSDKCHVSLRSTYLAKPIEGFRQLSLVADLHDSNSKGRMVLNPNSCTLNHFGDREVCTLLQPTERTVSLHRTRTADPQGMNRQLWLVKGAPLKGTLYLVVSKDSKSSHRLVYQSRNGERVVITMELLVYKPGSTSVASLGQVPRFHKLKRTVDGVKATAQVQEGFINGTYFLFLHGRKPHVNTWVVANPAQYQVRPAYWRIDIQECSVNDILIPTIGPYDFDSQEITRTMGTKGVDIYWANDEKLRIEIPHVRSTTSSSQMRRSKKMLNRRSQGPSRQSNAAHASRKQKGMKSHRGELRKHLIPEDYDTDQVIDVWAETGDLLQCYRPYIVAPDCYVSDITTWLRGDALSSVTVVNTRDPQTPPGMGEISSFLLAEREGISSARFLPVITDPKATNGSPVFTKKNKNHGPTTSATLNNVTKKNKMNKSSCSAPVRFRFVVTKPGEEKHPCSANKLEYRAWHVGSTVYLRAKGTHNTAGFQVFFRRDARPNAEPEFRLMEIRPTDSVANVLTPFEICTAYKAETMMRSVRVKDIHGWHVVAIHDNPDGMGATNNKEANILETAAQDGSFKVFLELVEKADLSWILRSNGPFTVLAPTDEAFRKIPAKLLDDIRASKEKLRMVMSYHICTGGGCNGIPAAELINAKSTITWGGKVHIAGPVAQEPQLCESNCPGCSCPSANLVKTDLRARNGVLHGIDTVLMPPFGKDTGSRSE